MVDWTFLAPLLAEANGNNADRRDGGIWQLLFPMVAIAVLWYFMLLRPQRREQTKREQLLKELKKNDRVVTIGGIIGTIANVSADNKEVTIKVDDNARLRMLRSSIQTVIRDEVEGEAAKT